MAKILLSIYVSIIIIVDGLQLMVIIERHTFNILFMTSYLSFQGRGNKSSGDNFHAAPNIDHSQDFVRNDLKEYLCWLRFVDV